MCGIAGVLVYRGDEPVDARQLEALRDAQRHRGPDDAGLWIAEHGRAGLAHRRLSIVDLSPRGHQPMATADGRFHVVYNGEVYNFLELRAELEARGHAFVSTSDTEVLLHGYREWGIALLDRLRGMFAFALYDAERRETLLARDPLGIKPLYVTDDGARLSFASEVQPLRRVVGSGGLDPEGLATYLLWGSIAPPRTLYRGIRALPAGSWLRVREGFVEGPISYFELERELGRSEAMSEEEAGARLRAALEDSTQQHLIADVPVGAFLSGGVDSSALVGLLSQLHPEPIRTVTLSFDVPALDEGLLAAEAARLYGTDHHEIKLGIDEVRDRIPAAIRALDQPSLDGINTYFVSEAAVKAGLKVAVSGVGGDELFGGYESFWRVPQVRATHDRLAAVPGLRPLLPPLGRLLERAPRTRRGAKFARALVYGGDDLGAYYVERGLFSPAEVRALLAPEFAGAVDACEPRAALGARVDLDALPEEERVSAMEFRQYLQVQLLRDTDAMSMRHSLEVRTPLVDVELLRAASRVPALLRRAGPAKRRLREAPRPPVPEALWNRTKQGFTLPFEHWMRTGGIPLRMPEHESLHAPALRRMAEAFTRGRVHFSRVWALLVLRELLD
jgi:asparagine synthase (glutamine-hydrolysing)